MASEPDSALDLIAQFIQQMTEPRRETNTLWREETPNTMQISTPPQKKNPDNILDIILLCLNLV